MMKFFRKHADLGITGGMARWYNKSTRNNRLEEMKAYADEAASYLSPGQAVLEVAPGPGYMSIALAKAGDFRITGMDISQDFVDICRNNAKEAGVNADFVQGNVSSMPFADETFHFIFCSAAFKNFHEPLAALNEMYRVLKPGALALIVDSNRGISNAQREAHLTDLGMKGLEKWFISMSFRYFLGKGAYTKDELDALAVQSCFESHDIMEKGISLFAYLRKKG